MLFYFIFIEWKMPNKRMLYYDVLDGQGFVIIIPVDEKLKNFFYFGNFLL